MGRLRVTLLAYLALTPGHAIRLGLGDVREARGDADGARDHREIAARELHAMGITLGAW